jgi:hypothetical protein
MEQSGLDSEEFLEKLKQSTMKLQEMEHSLLAAKKYVASYQDMLEQSQVSSVWCVEVFVALFVPAIIMFCRILV